MELGPDSTLAQPHERIAGCLGIAAARLASGQPFAGTGFRPALSTVHKRPELIGTFAVSLLGHRTVNGFHAHGGTAITLNLGARQAGSDCSRWCCGHCPGHVAELGGGRMTREVGTDVCAVDGLACTAFALVLAARADNVMALERGAGFGRSFRGESLSPDAVWLWQGGELLMRVNFADYHSVRLPNEVPQPMLLRTLADAVVVHPHFMLVRSAGATDLLRSGGKVTGVSARRSDGEIEVSARLTVGGRYGKALRPGLAVRKLPVNRDAWRFGLRSEAPSSQVNALAKAENGKSWVPDVSTTVVPKGNTPGVVAIGHGMCPALTQGINNAIVDGVTLAPMVSHALRRPGSSTAPDQDCSASQHIRARHVPGRADRDRGRRRCSRGPRRWPGRCGGSSTGPLSADLG